MAHEDEDAGLIHRVLELAPDIVYVYDLETLSNVYANRELTAHLGYSVAEVQALGENMMLELIHPEDLGSVIAHHQAMLDVDVGQRRDLRYRIRHKDGVYRWLESRDSAFNRRDGQTVQIVGIAADVTADQERRAQIERQEQLFRVIATQSTDVIAVHAPDRSYLYVSPAAKTVLGRTPDELLGDSPYRFVHPDDLDRLRQHDLDLELGVVEDAAIAYRHRMPSGAYRWVETATSLQFDGEGLVEVHTATRDATQRRRQQELAESEAKREVIGRLAAGVAHDFNNLLTVVSLGVGQGATEEDRISCVAAVERMAALTQQLLSFGRRQVINAAPIDLPQQIEQAVGLVRRMVPSPVRYERTDRPVPQVVADPSQVGQVLMNLVMNASHASPIDTPIEVSIRVHRVDRAETHDVGRLPAGEWVVLSVQDHGVGMSPSVLRRAFDPFFSTRLSEGGTGLGLPTIRDIVEHCGGHVLLDSTQHRGTTVACAWPAVPPPVKARRAQPATPAIQDPPHRADRLLLVDDDPAVLPATARALTRVGFQVLTARDGREAIDILERTPDVDLVVSDVVMPRMGGGEMLAAIAARGMVVPVLFISGYSPDELVQQGLLAGRHRLVHKPFSLGTLLAQIRSALSERSRPV